VRNDAAAHANRLVSQGQYHQALGFIETALREFDETPALAAARENARRALEDQERAAAIDKVKAQAKRLARKGSLDEAVRILEEALLRFPKDAELLALASQYALLSAQKRDAEATAKSQQEAALLEPEAGRASISQVVAPRPDPFRNEVTENVETTEALAPSPGFLQESPGVSHTPPRRRLARWAIACGVVILAGAGAYYGAATTEAPVFSGRHVPQYKGSHSP